MSERKKKMLKIARKLDFSAEAASTAGEAALPIIIVHGAELVFEGKKQTEDYHQEMNGAHFEEHLKYCQLWNSAL